jgi:hypothetical protein
LPLSTKSIASSYNEYRKPILLACHHYYAVATPTRFSKQ